MIEQIIDECEGSYMTQVLRGKIEPLALVEVLAYLGREKATGRLRVERDSIEKTLVISEGKIIFARSNQVEDRLGDMMLAQGIITQEQYDEGTALIYEKGFRHGRALVEIGAINPKMLWEKIQEQIFMISCSIIPWDSGEFEFIEQTLKQKESITLQLPIIDMVLDVVRNLDNKALLRTRFTDVRDVYSLVVDHPMMAHYLQPHEKHLFNLIDGDRNIAQICEVSDYGEIESIRVLYLMRLLDGIVLTDAATVEEVHPLIVNFNKIFSFIHRYLGERVGAVGTSLLKKYLKDVQESQLVLKDAELLQDGRLDPGVLQVNFDKLDKDSAEMVLDEAMNEYLNMCILTVRKVLGAEHENAVIKEISSIS